MLSTPPPSCIDERDLPRRLRRQAGQLLAAEWGAAWRPYGYAGSDAPSFRAVAQNNAAYLTAHVSAFAIPTKPELSLWGIGDLVVKRRYRGRGLALAVCSSLVAECRRRAADVVLVDTLAARHVFAALDFEPVRGFEFFYQRDDRCVRHEHWMVWRRRATSAPVELLEHGDF
ncbi:MAG: hypothetical protein NVSMB51_22140 [Solirubrobacteraceae bacterium]